VKIGDGPADVAVIASNPMDAVIWAIGERRKGRSVHTQFSGNRRRQFKRASESALEVVDLDKLQAEQRIIEQEERELFEDVFEG
jgi:hypothetical protein